MTYNSNNNLNKSLVVGIIALISLLISFGSIADSPKNITTPDRHSVEAKGKIGLYRVQVEGMNLGNGTDKADAEVFVTLDSNPKMVYALKIHNDSPAANRVIADTLRDAYIKKLPVTLYHQFAGAKTNNFKILMVQLN